MHACIVTGSTGFLGSYVVEALARSGRRVLAMTRRPVLSIRENVIPVTASLENLHPLRAAIAEHGCQAILHFAAAIPQAQASGAPDPQEQRAWRLDLSRSKDEIGYAPNDALDCGMRTVAAAMAFGAPRQTWRREP
ncbi:NAD-dependent epimerase/dehydratase family protein [Humidesulfovibrio sp.]